MNKILSIGIPTYNRKSSLEIMLPLLSSAISPDKDIIEVIIFDNCSIDETPIVINDWIGKNKNISIKHHRNSENIGYSRNLTSILEVATGDYFTFLGDDDCLNADNFKEILKILCDERPAAIIQADKKKKLSIESVGFDDALSLFYIYGNGAKGIIDRKAALKVIESRFLRSNVESIVWPQTVIGYLAMFNLSTHRTIKVVHFETCSAITESLNIYNKKYWIKCFEDLLIAGALVQQYTGSSQIRKKFININAAGFTSFIKIIFLNTLIDNDASSLSRIRSLLISEYGWRGFFWASILLVDNYSKILKIICWLAYIILYQKNKKKSFESMINDERKKREKDKIEKYKNGKRYGDWF